MKRTVCCVLLICLLLGVVPWSAQAVNMDLPVKSAILMDVATGTILYEQNAHEALAPASVTKVMTMLLIMEAIDGGQIGWQDQVTTSEAAAAKGGSQVYLKVGEQMTVADMVKAIAVSSANDCACAMAEHIAGSETAFVEKMNQRAKELGMNDTNFVNCTGLDDDAAAADHKTSAHDIGIMSCQLLKYHPDIKKYTTIWMDTLRNGTFGLSNTNKMVRFYPGATGLKTGFTSKAGYCLSASAQRDGMELVAVVMGAKTSAERFSACKFLLDYGFSTYAQVSPQIGEMFVPVTLGEADSVKAVPAEDATLLIEKAQKNMINIKTELEEGVNAPVSRGQKLGMLTVQAGDYVLKQIPLVAEEGVGRLSFGQLWVQVLRALTMSAKK